LAETKQRFSGLSHIRQCGEDVLRMFVTGGPPVRAAEDDKTILVDGTMNANSATTPRMMPIKNLTKNGPVGVLKRRCIMRHAHIYR
jgi:hypothetical protein